MYFNKSVTPILVYNYAKFDLSDDIPNKYINFNS